MNCAPAGHRLPLPRTAPGSQHNHRRAWPLRSLLPRVPSLHHGPHSCRPTASAAAATRPASKLLTPEQKSQFTRPPGWVAPGPQPLGPQGAADLAPGPDEDLSFLTGDWRIFQLKQGHRWSIDDMLTAAVAIQTARAMPLVARHLDVGCGIGSVLLMVAWGLPGVRGWGVEAQELSVGLARRSVRYNCGAGGRVQVLHGDARGPSLLPTTPKFDLITGTPPYIPPGAGIKSSRPQKGPCCFEERGGIEEYCSTAARYLAPGTGRFVVCSGIQGQPAGRTLRAAEAAGLQVLRRVTVVPKWGKPPLFNVDVMCLPCSRVAGEGSGCSEASGSAGYSGGSSDGAGGSSGGLRGAGACADSVWGGERAPDNAGPNRTGSSGASTVTGSSCTAVGQATSSSGRHEGSAADSGHGGEACRATGSIAELQARSSSRQVEELVVREADGQLTEAMVECRRLMGMPPVRQHRR